ncbi:stalk domain-containing protein [Rummeliibacillus pycnus]|uniref:stalk domain-containing protein n=1 Tax=Rummeliibacillus pycnus TaxID=101070 RepID=UPI000C9B5ECA|nr:stalk domain-containing protein [Rummeliibacillus pycnus]
MKKSLWMITPIMIFSLLGGQYIAHADDDDGYEHHEKNEHFDEEYEHDHDDEDKYYEENYQNAEDKLNTVEQGQWNIWTRSITDHTNSTLPFKEAKIATFNIDNNTFKLYVVPKKGELFVPAGKLTKLLGGQSTYYKNSKIIDTNVNGNQLIFRANTNVVYENLTKTPIPAKTFEYKHDIYVPVSVILNSLGYSIDWQQGTQQFLCQVL